jgi:hypothetical protein
VEFRLLIDVEVIEAFQPLGIARRWRLLDHLRKIQSFPGHYSTSSIRTISEGVWMFPSLMGLPSTIGPILPIGISKF